MNCQVSRVRRSRGTQWMASLALCLGAAMAASPVLAAGASVSPPAGGQAHLTLPVPAGRYPVGTVSLDLTDRARGNPWTASRPTGS
jgi:hypothetical protein